MTRDDERKETNASMARSPAEARRREEPHVTEHVSKEADEPERQVEEEGEDSSLARTRAGAKAGAERHARGERAEEAEGREKHAHEVKGGRGIMREHVDADHVIGTGGEVETKSAEGVSDMASAKANRKEADEPEREENEQAAMGRERSVPTKHTMGHGERETVAKHTI
jgi:hypothetical protein